MNILNWNFILWLRFLSDFWLKTDSWAIYILRAQADNAAYVSRLCLDDIAMAPSVNKTVFMPCH